ncbi:RecQ family ATP-dependent DNA helicase [Myxococcota bacterium]|nr:RecQ family ATP-dependent DNA helicase [Myxococcota bacterium]
MAEETEKPKARRSKPAADRTTAARSAGPRPRRTPKVTADGDTEPVPKASKATASRPRWTRETDAAREDAAHVEELVAALAASEGEEAFEDLELEPQESESPPPEVPPVVLPPSPRKRPGSRTAVTPLEPIPAPLTVDEAARRIGIERLYPEQAQVVEAVTAGRDVLMVLPTGFGKSACYQVPAMMLPQPVVLISPLLALLEDQHTKLLARGIRVARLDGTVRGNARKRALADVARGGSILVMTTPETLANLELRTALASSGVGLVAVDEAHCISEWGFDFRPAYRRLGARVRELGAPPVLALTATATEQVREAIVGTLGMREPEIVASSPHRSNLAFEVLPCEGDVRLRALLRLTRRLHRPGIIYCSTRREVELVYMLIRRFGIPAHRYHGGMTGKERETEQERFMDSGRRVVMVATSAFGLGIDKPDIRFVLHFQAPASLEQYVQEAGRGGRDGKKANCILLYDGSDRGIHEALLARSRVRPDQLYRLAAALAAWADEAREPSLEALALSAEMGPRVAAALLTKLEEAGLTRWDEKNIQISGSKETLVQDARALAGQFETLRTEDSHRLDALADYARDEGCRAVFLRAYFGESEGEPCGLCDVCRGRPERSEAFFAPIAKPVAAGRGRGGRRGAARGREQPAAREARSPQGRRSRRGRDRSPARGGSDTARTPRADGSSRPEDARRRRGRRGGRRTRDQAHPGARPLIDPEILAQPFVLDEAPPSRLADPRPRPARPSRETRNEVAGLPGRDGDGARRRRRGRRGGRRRRERETGASPGPGSEDLARPPPHDPEI